MQIRRFLKFLFVGIFCVFCISNLCLADEPAASAGVEPPQETLLTEGEVQNFRQRISGEITDLEDQFANNMRPGFTPIEVRIGLMLMKALSAIDVVLQKSLVRYTIIFLFIMYAFWILLEAHKLIRESGDYKAVLYDMFKKGLIIAAWVLILNFGPAKIFTMLIGPVMSVGVYFSDLIFGAVAKTYDITMYDTCGAIRDYVATNSTVNIGHSQTAQLLIEPEVTANIMCLPGRISTYFYTAALKAFGWLNLGILTGRVTIVIIGAVSLYIFIKCIFKYAFMTLGVVADLFLNLLMLPFTAIAEAMPSTKESNYAGQIFSGFLKMFNAKKLSDIILVFINAVIYFITLSIVISICAILLKFSFDQSPGFSFSGGISTLLGGCFILYLANHADEMATQLGGKIDNSFGKQAEGTTKTLWGNVKKLGGMLFKTFLKK